MPTPSPPSSAAAGAPSASPSSVPSYHDEVDPARRRRAAKVARLRDRCAPRSFAAETSRWSPRCSPLPPPSTSAPDAVSPSLPRGGDNERPRAEDPARDATADATADPIAHVRPPPRSALFYRMFDAGVPTGPIEPFPIALEIHQPRRDFACWTPSPRTPLGNSPPVSRAPISSPRGAGPDADHPLLYSRPIGDAWRARRRRRRANDYEPRPPRVGVRGTPPFRARNGSEDVGTRRRDDPEELARVERAGAEGERCATARRRGGSRGGTSAAERRAGVDVQATGGSRSSPSTPSPAESPRWIGCASVRAPRSPRRSDPVPRERTRGRRVRFLLCWNCTAATATTPWRSRDCTRTSRRWSWRAVAAAAAITWRRSIPASARAALPRAAVARAAATPVGNPKKTRAKSRIGAATATPTGTPPATATGTGRSPRGTGPPTPSTRRRRAGSSASRTRHQRVRRGAGGSPARGSRSRYSRTRVSLRRGAVHLVRPGALWRNANDGGRGGGGAARRAPLERFAVFAPSVHQARRVRIVLGAEARMFYGERSRGDRVW